MDRKIFCHVFIVTRGLSLSARRAWIENLQYCCPYLSSFTSLSARRAWIEKAPNPKTNATEKVALRKESVDRKWLFRLSRNLFLWSLSARRAWIEKRTPHQRNTRPIVALRKESVDRKLSTLPRKAVTKRSLSARRAWIEKGPQAIYPCVIPRRSPQGERG